MLRAGICSHPHRFLVLQSQDVELLSRLLEGVSFTDKQAVAAAAKSFHSDRRAHAATINILANALYQVRLRLSCPSWDVPLRVSPVIILEEC